MAVRLNPEESFNQMKSRMADAVKNVLQVDGRKNRVVVTNVDIQDDKDAFNFPEQIEAKDKVSSWAVPVRATVELRDIATNTLLSTKTMKVADLPKTTARFSYIVDGGEYQVQHQFRRMPGVYTRVAENGQIQAVAGGGWQSQLRVFFDPDSRKITIKPKVGSDSSMDVYPFLKYNGVSDHTLEKAWGKEILDANRGGKEDSDQLSVLKGAKLITGREHTDVAEAAKTITEHLGNWKLDPRVTKDTLGEAHLNLTPEAMTVIGKQLIGVSKGTVAPSSYDNIGHKEFLGAEDLLFDYLNRNKVKLHRKIKNRLDKEYDISRVVKPQGLAQEVTKFFKTGETQLSSRADQTNPVAMVTGAMITTVSGMGGISKSVGQSMGSAQLVHGSHLGYLDPIDTGEKAETGLLLPMPLSAEKEGNRIVSTMFNVKTNKMEKVDSLVAYNAVVAYPDDIRFVDGKPVPKTPNVRVSLPGGKLGNVPFSQVQYIIPTATGQFSIATNLVPFLGNNNGNRVMMAAKMARQAVSLESREEPLVQIQSRGPGETFEKSLGKFFSHTSKVDGTVVSIDRQKIVVRDASGKDHTTYLYDRFQTNEPKTSLNSYPIVKVGDKVRADQVIADQSFTKNGTLALGTNLRVGYIPMKGYNFEDGVVISRSAAQKLTSQHTYQYELEASIAPTEVLSTKELDSLDQSAVVISKRLYQAWAANSSRVANFNELDDSGVIKEGSKVEMGDILIAAIQKSKIDKALSGMRKLGKGKDPWRPVEISWDHDTVGIVSKVVKNGKKVVVHVSTKESMTIGDKLVGRYGNKGVVTKILEDREMPHYVDHNNEKQHIEVALNPAGIPGRINPGQVFELAAGKIAQKTGKPYIVKNFDSDIPDMADKLEKELASHGLKDQEDLVNPETGNVIGKVLVGPQYIQKLVFQVDKKFAARSGGPVLGGKGKYGIDVNKQPTHGGQYSGQALSTLGLYALLGHNARANIRELQTHKSTYETPEPGETGYDSDDFWASLMSGTPLPQAQPTFAYRKFLSFLKAAGVNPVKNGDEIHLIPLTDKEVLKTAPHEVIDAAKFLKGVSGEPDTDGLFDFPDGQINSKQWGHIKLAEPLPNPMFQDAIGTLLDLGKSNNVDAVIAGKMAINGETGGHALKKALQQIDPKKEVERLKLEIPKMRKTEKDKAYKRLRLLTNLAKLNMGADEAYMMQYMPILPPVMRPISISSSPGALGDIQTADVNELYKQVGLSNRALVTFDPSRLPEDRDSIRSELYEAVKRTYLEGAKNTRGQSINSIMQTITKPIDKQNKEGFYQQKIIKRRSELSARAVIVPEPSLNLDEIGMPRKMALEIYRPFIVRELKASGYATGPAAKKIEQEPNSAIVNHALERVAQSRPVLIKRDPVLHKFNVMAFTPVIHEGKSVQIHPLVTKGFNADFDGDTMAVFAPATDKAVEEARAMMPSKNLFSATNYGLMNVPNEAAAFGIYQLSEIKGDSGLTIKTPVEAWQLYRAGKLPMNSGFTYAKGKTTVGRMQLHNALPDVIKVTPLADSILYGAPITSKRLKEILTEIGKTQPHVYSIVMDKWKNLGNDHSYQVGSSVGLKDFKAQADIRDKHLADADSKLSKITNPTDREKVDIYRDASKKITSEVEERLSKADNQLYKWTLGSGALGKWNQVTQMVASPLQVTDAQGKVVVDPIRKAYSEGLSTADYWTAVHGVRSGTLSRVKETQEPGAKAKGIINLAINLPIATQDCGTVKGLMISTTDPDCEGRYISFNQKFGDIDLPHNTLITPSMLARLKAVTPEVNVRSTLMCELHEGVCSKCAGLNENGRDSTPGMNVGVLAGQALSEPLVQMTMNAFHTGGSASGAGAQATSHFDRVSDLFNMTKPESMQVKATISTEKGKVAKIEEDKAAGGYFIHINGKSHRVPTGLNLLVAVGDSVEKGQALSEGPVSPHELLKQAGLGAVQGYLLKEFTKIYGNYGVRRRNVETVLRNLTGSVTVVSDPTFEYAPGEVLTTTRVAQENEERKKDGLEPIEATPVIKGIAEAVKVMAGGDWMARMNYQLLESAVTDSALYGQPSKLHGANPIPGIAYGAEFGENKNPKESWKY